MTDQFNDDDSSLALAMASGVAKLNGGSAGDSSSTIDLDLNDVQTREC